MKLTKNKPFDGFTTDLFSSETNLRMKQATILGAILLLLPIILLSLIRTNSGLLFEEFMFRLTPMILIYPTIFIFLWKYAQPETRLTSSPATYRTFILTLILCCFGFAMIFIKPYYLDSIQPVTIRATGTIITITPHTTVIAPKHFITLEQNDGKVITLTSIANESLVVGSYQTFDYYPRTKIVKN